MKKITLGTMLCLLSMSAFAEFGDMLPNITPVKDANYICVMNKKDGDGAMAIKTTSPAKMWQLDAGDFSSGLELNDVKVSAMRCPDCFRVTATMGAKDSEAGGIIYDAQINRTGSRIDLKLDLTDIKNSESTSTIRMKCSKL